MDDLITRLRNNYENWSIGSKGPGYLLEAADALATRDARIAELTKRNEELEHLFDIQWKRTREAGELWRQAHPGNDLVSPDLGELVKWLMDRATAAEARLAEQTYSSTQETECAGCGERKHTPLRRDHMGGYVCLTCIDTRLDEDEASLAEAERVIADAKPIGWAYSDGKWDDDRWHLCAKNSRPRDFDGRTIKPVFLLPEAAAKFMEGKSDADR